MDLYLDNPHQASVSYPFSSIDANVNADANTRCGQSLKAFQNLLAKNTYLQWELKKQSPEFIHIWFI